MMQEGATVQGLLKVLEAEELLYVELRDLLQHERTCMVNLDASGLEEAVRRKEALAAEGRLLEESRSQVARTLAEELGVTEDPPTLSRLCDRLGARAGRLRETHTRLVALLGAVRELVDANASFAGDSLAQVRATLRLFGRMLPPEPTYRPEALGRVSHGSGRLVRRSA